MQCPGDSEDLAEDRTGGEGSAHSEDSYTAWGKTRENRVDNRPSEQWLPMRWDRRQDDHRMAVEEDTHGRDRKGRSALVFLAERRSPHPLLLEDNEGIHDNPGDRSSSARAGEISFRSHRNSVLLLREAVFFPGSEQLVLIVPSNAAFLSRCIHDSMH